MPLPLPLDHWSLCHDESATQVKERWSNYITRQKIKAPTKVRVSPTETNHTFRIAKRTSTNRQIQRLQCANHRGHLPASDILQPERLHPANHRLFRFAPISCHATIEYQQGPRVYARLQVSFLFKFFLVFLSFSCDHVIKYTRSTVSSNEPGPTLSVVVVRYRSRKTSQILENVGALKRKSGPDPVKQGRV